jgi:hypothetical protein
MNGNLQCVRFDELQYLQYIAHVYLYLKIKRFRANLISAFKIALLQKKTAIFSEAIHHLVLILPLFHRLCKQQRKRP